MMPYARCINDDALFKVDIASLKGQLKYKADFEEVMPNGEAIYFTETKIKPIHINKSIPRNKRYLYFEIEGRIYKIIFPRDQE